MSLDFDDVAEILSDLECLNFFPTTDAGRLSVQKIVGSMASSLDQVRWLVARMLQLYNNWPGPAELRAVFCKRYPPADGIDTRRYTSEFFPDGMIPCETPEAPAFPSGRLLARGRADLLLPAGHEVSANADLENEVRRASAPLAMTAAKRSKPPVLVPVKNAKRITAGELERIAAELKAARSAPHAFAEGAGGLCSVCWRPAGGHAEGLDGGLNVDHQKTA